MSKIFNCYIFGEICGKKNRASVIKTYEQVQPSLWATEDVAYSSSSSVRFSSGMHRTGAVSGKMSSHTPREDYKIWQSCAPKK